MLTATFGMEIEMTGITRKKAAQLTAEVIGGRSEWVGGGYDTYQAVGPDGRKWKFMTDGSIDTYSARGVYGGREYSTEFVTPICRYEQDMDTIQEIVRTLRHNGAFVNDSCGVHIPCLFKLYRRYQADICRTQKEIHGGLRWKNYRWIN